VCVQAHVFCTSRRATVVVVALSLGALTVPVIRRIVGSFHNRASNLIFQIKTIVSMVLLPVTVFIVNMIVLCQVRRASNSAAANLGLQQHHQSTSSNSAVPTVMLITTSFLYVIFTAPTGFVWVLMYAIPKSAWCSETWGTSTTLQIVYDSVWVTSDLYHVIFAYNFVVYVITSKQFRSELRQLCSCCSSADNNAPATTVSVRTPQHGQAVTCL